MPKLHPEKTKYVKYLLRFAIAGGAVYLAFKDVDPKATLEVLLGLNLGVVFAAIGLYILGQMLFVVRWKLLMRVLSIRIGFWPALRLHFLGLLYNNCLPSSVGGDLLRAWYITKHTDKKLEAALSVFVDRAVGLAGLVIMALSCYWFVPEPKGEKEFASPSWIDVLQQFSEHKWLFLAIIAGFAALVAVILASPWGRRVLTRLRGAIRTHSEMSIRKVRAAAKAYFNRKLAVFSALMLTFCLQGVCVASMWLIGQEIGISAHPKYYFIFFPISWLLGTLPISVGGAGIMELWLSEMFRRVCGPMAKNPAAALAISQRLLWLLGSLPGVAIHLFGGHLPKDFSVDLDKTID